MLIRVRTIWNTEKAKLSGDYIRAARSACGGGSSMMLLTHPEKERKWSPSEQSFVIIADTWHHAECPAATREG
ncbi:MAG: hypothetical protein NTV68_10905 [Methanomicrobiales archaeon]|nr:hypothetical protein [Methanomicrobiales archaeon]